MIVILCENSSGLEILLGEGGDVELGARTSNVCDWFTCVFYFLFIHSYIVDLYSYNKIVLHTSNSYLEESRGRSSEPFMGYTASNLSLSDRCVISFLICALFVY